jgi:hypothetical protein
MAPVTICTLDYLDTKVSSSAETREGREERIASRMVSVETRSNAIRLALRENLSSVILEPTPGRAWQYSRAGLLMAQDEETSAVVAKSKGTPYAICALDKDGVWHCSIVDAFDRRGCYTP